MVLGGGRVGGAIVRDLAADEGLEVVVADVDPVRVERMLDSGADGLPIDLSEPEGVARAVQGADLVVGAVPGFLGYRTAECVIGAGIPMVDISFFPEDAFELQEQATAAGVPLLVDCGVAPGLSNLVLGHLEEELDRTRSFRCYVGGLPVERAPPWEYKAPFSPRDVLEEYMRPARQRKDGRELTLPALSDVEQIDFPGLGKLEAFNTDGLRSLLRTCSTPTMIEKTMRYPGHAERIRVLRDAGFLSATEVLTASGAVRPRDVTEALLFHAWQFDDGEPDLTAMRVTVDGTRDGTEVRYTYNLLDHYDPETETSSMARTTGYTCTAIVGLVAEGLWNTPGVAAPEALGRDPACYRAVRGHLEARGVHLFERVEEVEG